MATRDKRRYGSELIEERGRLLPAVGLVGGLAVWWAVTALGSGIITNFAPADAFAVLAELLVSPGFYDHVFVSIYRFGLALGLCLAAGLPIGVLVGYFRAADRATTVLFQFMRMISPLAWFPIAIIVFGVGTQSAVFVMFMAGIWPIVLNTAHGIATIDDDWLTVGESLGGDTRALLRRVVVPAVIPDMLTGIRLSIGILWIILVPAEMLGVNTGLGYLILDARDRFAYAEIPAIMLVIGFIGFWLDLSVRRLHARWNWG
ncbi:ABC transporter permease [Halobellus ruber]|uniref:ABC transporter permease n=1 Tax=Halobellus ruber TaxID=2761102 RepID=A0A7J9SGH6_9EURY|nr:ABC transporter permease [Halobellus ruber]MBB6645239.1 ABC transporter permease [Halobellus ruber]